MSTRYRPVPTVPGQSRQGALPVPAASSASNCPGSVSAGADRRRLVAAVVVAGPGGRAGRARRPGRAGARARASVWSGWSTSRPSRPASAMARDGVVADDPPALAGQAVGEHRHAAGGPDQRDAVAARRCRPWPRSTGCAGAAGWRRRRRPTATTPACDQRAGDVRAADHAAVADAATICSQVDRVAGRGQVADEPLGAGQPLVAQPGPLGEQAGVVGVEQVGQQVHADRRRRPAGNQRQDSSMPGHQGEPGRARGGRPPPSRRWCRGR